MRLSYQALASRVRSVDPYRGTMRFPMANRSNRNNTFELVEKDGEVEFHVAHNHNYTQTEISEARYKMLEDVRGVNVHKKTREWEKYDYYTTSVTPRTLCIVRSDNSMEYVVDYHQGDNMKMSDWLGGCQYDSYRVSGTAYSNWNTNINIPVFKGLRVSLDTFDPVGMNVKVFRRSIDRKKSRELMSNYKEVFKAPEAMLKCMDMDTMVSTVRDVLDEHLADDQFNVSYLQIADKLKAEGANFDATVFYAMAVGIGGFNRWAIQNFQSGRSYYRLTDPKLVVERTLQGLSKRVYKEHQPFHEEEVDFKSVKGSEWGIRIEVDGKTINN